MRPFGGIRGVWIDQDYRAKYKGEFSSVDAGVVSTIVGKSHFHAENDFVGAGIRGGTDFVWHFSRHWGIKAKASGTLVYGQFDIDQHTKGFNLSSSGATVVLTGQKFELDDEYNRARFNVEGALGLQWEKVYPSSRRVGFSLSYEVVEWFQQNMMIQTTEVRDSFNIVGAANANNTLYTLDEKNGNLGFHGVTAELRCDF